MKLKNIINYPLNPKALLRSATLEMIRNTSNTQCRIVDVGCGEKPLEEAVLPYCFSYTGIDIDGGFYKHKKPDIYGSAYDTTLPEASCDIVLSMQVFEHLKNPQSAIKEISRILKKDGNLIVSFPFSYPLHAAPYDYFRYTKFGFISMLEEAGFKVLEIREVSGIFMVFSTYLYNHFIFRGPFKVIGIMIAWFFYLFHALEGYLFYLKGSDVANYRSQFVVNYILKASKV